MADGTRPGSVTAAAIVGLIGSVGTAAVGLFMLLGAAAMNRPEVQDALARQPTPPPISPAAMMIAMGVMALAFAVWGVASAVGVLRLRNWGRISFVVYGGLLAAFGVMDAVGAAFSAVLFKAVPQNANLPQGVLAFTMGVMAVIALAIAAIGVWWLILFNLAAVKAAFVAVGDVTRESARIPVRIAVVAWFFVGSIVLSAAVLLITRPKIPALILGMEMRGWAAFLVVGLQYSLTIVAGVGLLRKWSQAHALAIGLFVFGIINVGAMALRPGGLRGVFALYQSSAGPSPLPPEFFGPMGVLMMIGGIIFNVALGALLISGRRRYLEACAAAEAVSS